MRQLSDANIRTVGRGTFFAVRAEVLNKYRISLFLRQSPASKGVNTEAEEIYWIGSRYQTTTGKDTADWEDLVRTAWIHRVLELEIAL
jgi:hypothetical protein